MCALNLFQPITTKSGGYKAACATFSRPVREGWKFDRGVLCVWNKSIKSYWLGWPCSLFLLFLPSVLLPSRLWLKQLTVSAVKQTKLGQRHRQEGPVNESLSTVCFRIWAETLIIVTVELCFSVFRLAVSLINKPGWIGFEAGYCLGVFTSQS